MSVSTESIVRILAAVAALTAVVTAVVTACRAVMHYFRKRTAIPRRTFRQIDRGFLRRQSGRSVNTVFGRCSLGLSWPLVAQKQAFERDLHGDLMGILETPRGDRPCFMLIRGRPGEGKTTFLHQIGRDLALKGHSVLELRANQILSPERSADFLDTCSIRRRRRFVLIDDVFRYEGIDTLLSEPDLTCTIIATSRLSEDRSTRLEARDSMIELKISTERGIQWPQLESISDTELSRLRRNTCAARMSDQDWAELVSTYQNEPLLALLISLQGGGHPANEIIRDALERLEAENIDSYEALGFVAAFHQFGLGLPGTLLASMVSGKRLAHQLKSPHGLLGTARYLRGLLVALDRSSEEVIWGTPHEIVAQMMWDLGFQQYFVGKLPDLVSHVDPSRRSHNLAVHSAAVRLCERRKSVLAQEWIANLRDRVDIFCSPSNPISAAWASLLLKLGESQKAEALAMRINPQDAREAHIVIRILESTGHRDHALALAQAWIHSHESDTYVRTQSLGLQEREERATGIPISDRAIQQAWEWLKVHKEDSSVRTRFLGMIENHPHSLDVPVSSVMQDTWEWLKVHKENSDVRTRFLGMIENHPHSLDVPVSSIMQHTWEWLKVHKENSDVRTRFLATLEKLTAEDNISPTAEMIVMTAERVSTDNSRSNECVGFLRLLSVVPPNLFTLADQEAGRFCREYTGAGRFDPSVLVMLIRLACMTDCGELQHEIVKGIESLVTMRGSLHATVMAELARLVSQVDTATKASVIFRKAAGLPAGSDPRVLIRHASFLIGNGDARGALAVLDRLVSPLDGRALEVRAEAENVIGNQTVSEATWWLAINLSDHRARPLNGYSRFLLAQDRLREARCTARAALVDQFSYFWAEKTLGDIESVDGNAAEAKFHYHKALSAVPLKYRYRAARVDLARQVCEALSRL